MKEVIHLHIGEAGIQLASACWQLFCLEHGVAPDGTIIRNTPTKVLDTFFEENSTGKYIARSMCLDLDSQIVDEFSRGIHRYLFMQQQLIAGKQNAAHNYARGYYSKSKQIINIAFQQLRKTAERCHNFQTFLFYNSLGGGTGSGFTSLLMEKLSEEYPKKMKVGLSVFPDVKVSKSCTEPYNTVLIANKQLSQLDFSIVLDNQAIGNICKRNLAIQNPNYSNINRVIAQTVSAMTVSLHLEGKINTSFNQMYTNLVAFPRMNNILSSFAPFISKERMYLEKMSVGQISRQAFEPANQMARCDPRHGKYMACVMAYHGDIVPKDISACFASIKSRRTIQFVDWAPTGFRVGINYQPLMVVPEGDIGSMERSCSMLSNSTAISEVFGRMNYKFDVLYSKRAFVHWYIQEGQEESQLREAREELAALEADYEQVEKQDIQQNEQVQG